MARYHAPTSVEEALRLLSTPEPPLVMAGATDLYPAWTAQESQGGRRYAGDLLDISRIEDLDHIHETKDHWWIGALTTWATLMRAPLSPQFDGLKVAAREIGGMQIQNRGTIGGNICTASPAADSVPCLLALDAEVTCAGGKRGRVPLAEFVTGPRRTALGPAELVTGVRIPKQPGHGHFLKLGARRHLVISIVMVAGVIDLDAESGRIRQARIALGAASPVAVRLKSLEARLTGQMPSEVVVSDTDLAALSPIDDIRASAEYRRAAAKTLVQDLIARAAQGGEAAA